MRSFSSRSARMSRRRFSGASAALAAGAAIGVDSVAIPAHADDRVAQLVATPPAGFTPLSVPGKVTKVTKGTSLGDLMQKNQLWPKPDVARLMLERAMTDFTGAPNLVEAMKKFVNPRDVVAVKVNGIAGQSGFTMAVNFELILPVVEAVIAAGVPADHITVYEQYANFLSGTRVNIRGNKLPPGVHAKFHSNWLAKMPAIKVHQNIRTKYVQFLTEATAVIDMTLIKDHSICGYTGTLKNMTHGSIINPHDHHRHHADPQIADLYNHPIMRSRVRLHITDGYKIIYDQGPLDKNPRRRILHGAVYVATDPVAMDTIGWQVIEAARKQHGLKSLAQVGREPTYIATAASRGLGTRDLNAIRMRTTAL